MLMMAVAVTAYAGTVRTKIPVYGEESEREWGFLVATTFQQLGRSVAEGLESGAPSTTTFRSPPLPKSIDLPFLGSIAPQPPSGTVTFEPSCATASATHALASGGTVTDLSGGATGCVRFASSPVYSHGFGYTYELGGVLRLQGDKAVVLQGPPLELDATSPSEYRVAIALAGLRGDAVGVSLDAADVHADVVPGPAAPEVEQEPNAASLQWTFDTAYPAAWKDWFESRFERAGFASSEYDVACSPVDCSTSGGTGRVIVDVEGPRTDQPDIKLSITYGLSDLTLR